MKLGLIILTIQCASWITKKLGDHEKRTTNTMPYPSWITHDMQKGVKDMYTRAQFGATKTIVLSDPTLSYFPLLAIQIAPLLMTLVRKGKITSITYHRIYMNIDIFRVIHNILGNCQIDIVIFLFIMPLWCKWWTHIADIYMLKWLMIFTNVQPWINLHSVLKITFNTQYGVVINRLWLPSIMMSQM